MRRRAFVVAVVVVVAFPVLSASPAGALTRVSYDVAPQQVHYERDVVCPGLSLDLTERDGHQVTSFYEGDTIVRTVVSGAVTTEVASSLGVLTFDTIGSATVTPNGDGTWTMVQKGSGLTFGPVTDPFTSRLFWFTGTVISVGDWNEKGLVFTPTSQVRLGLASDVCDMLVAGLKRRHDF